MSHPTSISVRLIAEPVLLTNFGKPGLVFAHEQWEQRCATAQEANIAGPSADDFLAEVQIAANTAVVNTANSEQSDAKMDLFKELISFSTENYRSSVQQQQRQRQQQQQMLITNASASLPISSQIRDKMTSYRSNVANMDQKRHVASESVKNTLFEPHNLSPLDLHFPSTLTFSSNNSNNNSKHQQGNNTSLAAGGNNQVPVAALPFRGMVNRGNTCFAAGALTLLLTSPRIGTALEQLCQQGKAPAEQAVLLRQLRDARESILGNSNNNGFNIKDLIVDVPQYREGHQYDADEYLRHLLMQRAPCIYFTQVESEPAATAKKGTAKRRGREDAAKIVYDADDEVTFLLENNVVPHKVGYITLITGCSTTTLSTKCDAQTCARNKATQEDTDWSWSILQLPMKVDGASSVKQLIAKFMEADTVAYSQPCVKCRGTTTVMKSETFKHLPHVLLVQVGRFSRDKEQAADSASAPVSKKKPAGKKSKAAAAAEACAPAEAETAPAPAAAALVMKKRRDVVELTEVLELDATGKVKFELRGFVLHIGDTLESGHYISYARLPFAEDQTNSNGWIEFSDANVQRAASDLLTTNNTKTNVYLLRYERV